MSTKPLNHCRSSIGIFARRLVAVAGVAAAGCANDTALRSAQHRADSLDALLTRTRAELMALQAQPDRLLAQAQQALAADHPDSAIAAAKQLLTTHPEAKEATDARALIQQGEARIAANARAAAKAHDDSVNAHEARLASALRGMRKQHDDVKGITWYTDASVPTSHSDDQRLYLYIGKDDDGSAPFLRFVIRYAGSDWLFIEQYIIKTEARTFTLTPDDYGAAAVERDNGYGGVWEWWDVRATDEQRVLVDAVIASKHATLRYEGKQYYRDRTITDTERASLRRTLDAFTVLSGQH